MSTSREEIGARLRELRGDLTQQEFADKLKLSRSYISDVERGRSYPSIPFLVAIAVNCGTSLDWLLTGEEDPDQHKNYPMLKEERNEAQFLQLLEKLRRMHMAADGERRAWLRVELARLTQELQTMSSANHSD